MSEPEVKKLKKEMQNLQEKYRDLLQEETSCRETAADLMERNDFINSVMDSTSNAIFTVDTGGRFLYYNRAGARMSGYSHDELFGAHFFQLLPPEQYEEVAQRFQTVLKSGQPLNGVETTLVTKDGRQREVSISLSALKDGDRISCLVGTAEDVTERKEMAARLVKAATSDFLTGLANRRQFVALTEREISRSKRHGLPLCLVMLDLDHFKEINDNFGHVAGDTALKRLAGVLAREVRDHDVVGRLGGDEFGVALVHSQMHQARSIAERIRDAVASPPLSSRERGPDFTVSLGVAPLLPDDRDFNDLFRRADKALYLAKNKGRNRLSIVE